MDCVEGDESAKAGRHRRFILLVDSDAGERFYTSIVLQRFGYNVCNAASAEEALELLAVAGPALIVTDTALKGMSGLDLLGRIKQQPQFSAIPVIFLSSFTDPGMEDQCHFAGCADYLRKPVNAEELYRAIQGTIEKTPRKNLRISTYLKSDIGGGPPGGATYATVISEHGMFIETPRTRPQGEVVPVSLIIGGRAIRLDAIVLYSYGFGEGPYKKPGMGLKFARITDDDRAFIRAYILEELKEGLPKKLSS